MILNIKDIKTQYITLDVKSKRSKRLANQLKNYGFTNFEPILGIRDDLKRKGVAFAFLNAIENNSSHEKPFLLLEDDAVIWHDYDQIEIPDDADALYLGVCILGGVTALNSYHNHIINHHPIVKQIDDKIYRIYAMLNAHAVIIINPEYRDFLLKAIKVAIEVGTNQDRVRAETMKYWKVYALDKPMFYQQDADGQMENTKHTISDMVLQHNAFTDISLL
jgi:hypothetical protein